MVNTGPPPMVLYVPFPAISEYDWSIDGLNSQIKVLEGRVIYIVISK